MPEFYVAFRRDEVRYLAIVSAPGRPPELAFCDYASLRDAMDGLGSSWSLVNEIEDPEPHLPRSSAWLERLSAAMELRPAAGRLTRPPAGAGGAMNQAVYCGFGDAGFDFGDFGSHGYDSCGYDAGCGDCGGDGGGDG